MCAINYVEYNQKCFDSTNKDLKCPTTFDVMDYERVCKRECPGDSYAYFSFEETNSVKLEKYTSSFDLAKDCFKDTYLLELNQDS